MGSKGELVEEFACDDLIGCLHQQITDFLGQTARGHIGQSGSLLHHGHGLHEFRVQGLAGDVEIFPGPHGLHAVIYLIGNFQFA